MLVFANVSLYFNGILRLKSVKRLMRIFQLLILILILNGCNNRRQIVEAFKVPNIIFILTDDQGWTHTSHRADPDIAESISDFYETPNMDRLAKSGILFTQGYAPNPICSPSRHSLLFGQNAARHIYNLDSNWYKHTTDWLTIPRALKIEDPAYRTAHFGKWHVAMDPKEAGYDVHDGMTSNASGEIFGQDFLDAKDYTSIVNEYLSVNKVDNPSGARKGGKPSAHWAEENAKDVFGITDRAIKFMRASIDAQRPFYVQLSHYAAHLSLVSREDTHVYFKDKRPGARHTNPEFAATLKDLDSGIGQILDFVEEEGIKEHTFIFLMGDNGGRLSLNQIAIIGKNKELIDAYYSTQHQRNLPLRDGKHSFYEGGLRVPFMVAGPGIEANRISRTPVTGLDLLPTFIDLAGGSRQIPQVLDGGSLVPILFDEEESNVNRHSDYLVFHQSSHRMPCSAIRRGDFKLIKYWLKENKYEDTPRVELYDLSNDLKESHNMVMEYPEIADELESELVKFLKATHAETGVRNIEGPFYRFLKELEIPHRKVD